MLNCQMFATGMKRLLLLIALTCALAVQLNAQTTNPIPGLSGIVNLPDRKCALLEARDARLHSYLRHLIMSEGERSLEVEVLHINPERGTVELRVAGSNTVIALGSETNATTADTPAIALEKANFNSVLDLYAEFSGRTALQFPSLPASTFTLRAPAANRAEAAKVLEQAMADRDVVTIPHGEKFVLIVPKAQATFAGEHLAENKLAVPGENQTLPPGFVNMIGADLSQVLPIYADLVGRKLERNDSLRLLVVPIAFRNQTSLTKAEVVHAMDVLLRWRGIAVVPEGDDLIKPVLVSPK